MEQNYVTVTQSTFYITSYCNRPTFAAANQVVTPVTNERIVYLGRLVSGQLGSAHHRHHFICPITQQYAHLHRCS